MAEYHIGQEVKHEIYGSGVISEVNHENSELRVSFPKRRLELNLKFDDVEVIGEPNTADNVETNPKPKGTDEAQNSVPSSCPDSEDSSTIKESQNEELNPHTPYLVLDLKTFALRTEIEPPDLRSSSVRTDEIWFRRVEAGVYTIGSKKEEIGHSDDEQEQQIVITLPYYIAIFPLTQGQYKLIKGSESTPSKFIGDTRPLESISYADLRGNEQGSNWPKNKDYEVDPGSFFGVLRRKVSFCDCYFDLPTEAQWEVAARAGNATAFGDGTELSGKQKCDNLANIGRYRLNQRDGKSKFIETAEVGSYLPNNWGIYDMHGNVYEWCLDWYSYKKSESSSDPLGPEEGEERVARGGSYNSYAFCCSAARRKGLNPSESNDVTVGFRPVLQFLKYDLEAYKKLRAQQAKELPADSGEADNLPNEEKQAEKGSDPGQAISSPKKKDKGMKVFLAKNKYWLALALFLIAIILCQFFWYLNQYIKKTDKPQSEPSINQTEGFGTAESYPDESNVESIAENEESISKDVEVVNTNSFLNEVPIQEESTDTPEGE